MQMPGNRRPEVVLTSPFNPTLYLTGEALSTRHFRTWQTMGQLWQQSHRRHLNSSIKRGDNTHKGSHALTPAKTIARGAKEKVADAAL